MSAIILAGARPLVLPTTGGLPGAQGAPGLSADGYGTRSAMAARSSPSVGDGVYLLESGREGKFVVDNASSWTAAIAADTQQGAFVLSTADASKVYRRVIVGPFNSKWFGVSPSASASSNTAAFRAALSLFAAIAATGYGYINGTAPFYTPAGHYLFNDELKPESAVEIYGDSTILGGGTILEWTGSSGHGINLQGYDGSLRHATGSVVRNLHLKGWYSGTRAAQHGVYVNGTSKVMDVFCEKWPGIGVYGFGDTTTNNGNVSLSVFRNIYAEYCDLTLKLQGGDANACQVENIQSQANRLGTYWDWSFLGNRCFGGHSENNGLDTNFRSRCEKSGHIYVVKYGQETWCSTNAPSGTTASNTGWLYLEDGPTNFYTATWVTGQTWYFTAPFSVGPPDNGNTLGNISDVYVEGGQNPIILAQLARFTSTTGAKVWQNDGTLHGGSMRAAGYAMLFNNGLSLQGVLAALGTTHFFGPSSGAITDTAINLNTTNGIQIYFNRYNSAGALLAQDGYITSALQATYINGSFGVHLRYAGSDIAFIDSAAVKPGADNTIDLGSSGLRWKTVYAGTGTINTSDKRHKTSIAAPSDALLDAWGEVEWQCFKFKDAVEAKGKDGARLHIGLVAQHVRDVLERHKIDGFSLGLLCFDKWEEEREPIFEEVTEIQKRAEPNPKYRKQLDRYLEQSRKDRADGTRKARRPTEPSTVEIEQPVRVTRPKLDKDGNPVTRVSLKAGEAFGVRYDEAQALEAAWVRRELKRLSKPA